MAFTWDYAILLIGSRKHDLPVAFLYINHQTLQPKSQRKQRTLDENRPGHSRTKPVKVRWSSASESDGSSRPPFCGLLQWKGSRPAELQCGGCRTVLGRQPDWRGPQGHGVLRRMWHRMREVSRTI